ncbi:glycine betaine/L-proline ABC transporter ATPase [Caballeronia arationis]|nr:glycine betaine/L-proline ABC transporter ATPase [Caballeronia arationis]
MKDGRLIQVGTPAELIQSPADDYVRDFFHNVDVSRFLEASSLLTRVQRGLIACDTSAPSERYLNHLIDSGADCGYVCDEAGRYHGCVTPASLHKSGSRPIREALIRDVAAVPLNADLHQLAAIALSQEHDVPVTDEQGRLAGVVSCRTILKQVMQRRAA